MQLGPGPLASPCRWGTSMVGGNNHDLIESALRSVIVAWYVGCTTLSCTKFPDSLCRRLPLSYRFISRDRRLWRSLHFLRSLWDHFLLDSWGWYFVFRCELGCLTSASTNIGGCILWRHIWNWLFSAVLTSWNTGKWELFDLRNLTAFVRRGDQRDVIGALRITRSSLPANSFSCLHLDFCLIALWLGVVV